VADSQTFDNVLLRYCIVGPYIFTLHMLFYLNVQDNSDDV